MYNIATDRRCAMLKSGTPPVKNMHHWLHGLVFKGVYLQPSATLQNIKEAWVQLHCAQCGCTVRKDKYHSVWL